METLIISPIFGVLCYRVLLLIRLSQNTSLKQFDWIQNLLLATFAPWKTDFYEALTSFLVTEDENVPMSEVKTLFSEEITPVKQSDAARVSLSFGVNFDNKSLSNYSEQYGACDRKQFQEQMIISEMYRFLGILSSLFMCVALGSNDVANAISPLIILM
jgi:phosphate/sulfate permease